MRKSTLVSAPILCAGALALYACSERATQPLEAGVGPHPTLTAPHPGLLPTVNIAAATAWPPGTTPRAAPGLTVTALATGLDHPRWLYTLPNGDILVAESTGPRRPGDFSGIQGMVAGLIMDRAGAGTPSANRITLLREQPGGRARRFTFATGLDHPFGMALIGTTLYVANTDNLVSFPYTPGATSLQGQGQKRLDLPGGPIDHHWTKTVQASPDGRTLYVSVGSNSNVGEHGMDAEAGRAAVWAISTADFTHRIFASGLRNPVGLAYQPETHALWATVNERDNLGSDLVPDYMTALHDGAFYGWPYSYYGQHIDTRVRPQRPDLVAAAIAPDYALGAHTASLGLAFSRPGALPAAFTQGAFIGQHGSWNRTPRSGYKVVFVPFEKGQPAGAPVDVLTGFLDADGHARGRPVGVALDAEGALLVADDVGGTVWRVQ